MKVKIHLSLMLFLFTIALNPPALRAETLAIPGTGACEVLLKILAAQFNLQNPGREIIIPPSIGSGGAIRGLREGEFLLGRVARPLEGKEREYGLTYLAFARDPVVFAVGANVPISSLTPRQLADIFAGKITQWQEVGGPPAPIRVLLREPGDACLKIITKHLKEFRGLAFSPDGKILYHDHEMLGLLQKYNSAIGFLTLSSLSGTHTSIKTLAINDVMPTPANIQSKQYDLMAEYALIYQEKYLTKLARDFIDFIFSNYGQKIMEKYQVMPIKRE